MLEPLNVSFRYRMVQEQLRKYILANGLRVGDPLPSEFTLARYLRVSRSAVREGLRGLQAQGIIEIKPGVGSFLRALSLDDLLADFSYSLLFDETPVDELYQIRQILEQTYLPVALDNLTETDFAEIHALIQRMQGRIAVGQSVLDEDIALHRAIFRGAGNHTLLKLFDSFAEIYHRNHHLFDSRPLDETRADLTAHVDLVDAIERRDPVRALRALRATFTVLPAGVDEGSESVHQTIRDAIRRYIIANGLRGADRLPSEATLAMELGVSRSAVREAIKSLEAQGLIEVHVGLGILVREYRLEETLARRSYHLFDDDRSLQELYEIRQLLEICYIDHALMRLTDDDFRQLESLVRRMEARVEAGEDFTDEDVAFHRTIFSDAGNRVLIKLIALFAAIYQGARHLFRERPPVEIRDDLLRHKNLLTIMHTRNIAQVRLALADTFTALPSSLMKGTSVRRSAFEEVLERREH